MKPKMMPAEKAFFCLIMKGNYHLFVSRVCVLTDDNSPNSEEHKGVFLEESLDILLGDLFHFPLCLHGAYMNAFPESLHPDLEMMGLFQSKYVSPQYSGRNNTVTVSIVDIYCPVLQLPQIDVIFFSTVRKS